MWVIYLVQVCEVIVQVDNVGDLFVLVQVWIDSGDVNQIVDISDVLFVLMLLIVCVELGCSQVLCLIFFGVQLLIDCEMVFWFNVLDVLLLLDNVDSGEQNYLQVVFCLCLKFFYWLQGLKGVVNDVLVVLCWICNGDCLWVENLSFFYVILVEVYVVIGSSEKVVEDKGVMVVLKQSLEFVVLVGMQQVCFIIINDYGGWVEYIVCFDSIGG